MLVLLLALLGVLWLLWTYTYWFRRGVPCVTPLPLVGNFLETALFRKSEGFVLTDLYWWKERRSRFTQAMTQARVRNLLPVMLAKAQEMSEYVRRLDGREVSAQDLARRLTMDVAAAAALSLEAGCFKEEAPHILSVMKGRAKRSGFAALKMALFSNFPALALGVLGFRILSEEVENVVIELVRASVAQQRQKRSTKNDLLGIFAKFAAKDTIDEQELVEAAGRVLVVFAESFEATATILSAALHSLAQHAEVQHKVRAELLQAYPDKTVTSDELDTLPYLDAVITETVRLNESSTTMTRVCTEAATLRADGQREVRVEPGTFVVIPVYAMHHDPKHFPEPDRFYPERFLGAQPQPHKYAFLPFGEGPRICIGMKYSMTTVKTAVAHLMMQWSVEVGPSQRVSPVRDENAAFFSQYTEDIKLRFRPLPPHT